MRNTYRRPLASSTASSNSPRNRSSSGAARNVPSSTFLPNRRPLLLTMVTTSRSRAASWVPRPRSLHQVMAVGEGALAHVEGHAGLVEEVVELHARLLADPARAGGHPVGDPA